MSSLLCGGLTTIDLAYLQDELPVRGGKGTTDRSYIDVGGPVANAAVTAAILGSEVQMHSVLGSGVFADLARETQAAYSVSVFEHGAGIDLPVASIWIDGTGERTILSTSVPRSKPAPG